MSFPLSILYKHIPIRLLPSPLPSPLRLLLTRHKCCPLLLFSCSVFAPTLCDAVDCSTPGFPVLHISWSWLKLMCIEPVMPSNRLILCHALLLLPSLPLFSSFAGKLGTCSLQLKGPAAPGPGPHNPEGCRVQTERLASAEEVGKDPGPRSARAARYSPSARPVAVPSKRRCYLLGSQ